MGIWGFANAILQACFLGPALRRFGPKNMLLVTFMSFVIILPLYPCLRFFVQSSGKVDGVVWTIVLIQLFCAFGISGAYSAMQIIVVNSSPTRATLGATNGLAQEVASGTRAAAPTIASSLFSVSLQRQLLGGNFAFVVLFGFTLIAIQRTARLPIN